ncbi:hypothetical protein K7X08_011556 [Anisodus acutangulus]|uniref:Uncharacterized protein n=1 Tax=Anisodus acutangulus TaxID=402998 RepID=A0A9Q1RLH9_9SOLA|nr:hypothetical protein K7X08_011556 [Anisodus acutangulus]
MEQVSQQAALSANGEDPIDEQAIVVYSGVVAEHPILVCNSLTCETIVPESVARGSVQSQGGESSEESDDDFADITDITSFGVDMACDIGTPTAMKTYK